jgi:hypothetical protein
MIKLTTGLQKISGISYGRNILFAWNNFYANNLFADELYVI